MGMSVRFVFVIIGMVLGLFSEAQNTQIRFEHLDDRDGLSHNRVTSILRDELGFMWFGTLSGLNRFDGFEIKVLTYNEADPRSINNSNIIWIKEGPGDRIWAKTSYGVYAYDIYKEKLIDVSGLLLKLGVDNYNLKDIKEDKNGRFWFLVNGVGLHRYDPKTEVIDKLTDGSRSIASILVSDQHIRAIYTDGIIESINIESLKVDSKIAYPSGLHENQDLEAIIDNQGAFWFFSPTDPIGAYYYDPNSKIEKSFAEEELGSVLVTGIIEDGSGNVIVGIDHSGITIINKANWKIQKYVHNPADPKSLSHDAVVSLYKDPSGMIWIGTNKGGINYYAPKSLAFNFYKQTDSEWPNENDILQVQQGDGGKLWLGTDGGGLLLFDQSTGSFKRFSKKNSNLSSDIIVSLESDGKGGLWIGTYLGGLNHFDGKDFRVFKSIEGDPTSLSDNSIWRLYRDKEGQLWVGTFKGGVDVFNEDLQKVQHFDQNGSDVEGLTSNYITAFEEDVNGRMWIGSGYGISIYDPRTDSFTTILKDENNPKTISNNSILDIFRDSNDGMWAATMYGLNKISLDGVATRYTKSDGLPHDIVSSIEEDSEGNLWFGTYKGLSRLNLNGEDVNFTNFDVSDGLQGDTFNERSVEKLGDGRLAFGGKNGLNVFNPKEIKASSAKTKLLFLDFYISNQQIHPDEIYNDRKWFENGLNNTESIDLRYYENSFSFGFTSLNFYQQENIVYRHQLHGFDTTWVSHSNARRANYTNLDPGNYRFEVMVMDQNDPQTASTIGMDIVIHPPYWRTPLAYFIYVILGIGVLYVTRNLIIQKERFRARIQQERLDADRIHELDTMKLRFFTNISHEFRTPLTLIITPITRLLKQHEGKPEERYLKLIYRNAKRLLTLVNQLLDLRKMEVGEHQLALSTGDLISFSKHTMEHFSDLSDDKLIALEFKSNMDSFMTYFDRDKMEKVFFNLLSNAFKFTEENGKITVSVERVGASEDVVDIQIKVSDTGVGMSTEECNKIFDRFFQIETKDASTKNHGSGIGLSITKDFIEMHGGEIFAESRRGIGTTFIIHIPMKPFGIKDDVGLGEFEVDNDVIANHPGRPTVLITEDNNDFRNYLIDCLSEHFNMMEASNGKEAWKKLMQAEPDVVVSDILMPEMDGVEFCTKMKKDPRTAHIPVIMLTSLYSDEQKVRAFDAGASEYITKPFNFEILLRSIRSAIQLQEFIHKSENRMDVAPSEIEIIPLDERLINNAKRIVEDNMSNADFSVQELSRELGVSRGQLYKKTLEITGKTPIEFIRAIRLKRAAALLSKSQMTVAEVAYAVGFNNPKYFANYFRAEYNILPSKYRAQEEGKSETVS